MKKRPPVMIGTPPIDRLRDPAAALEWLEADGLGGFASGTVCGIRTAKYHALLNVALDPPTNRRLLVAGLEETLEIDDVLLPFSAQRYADGSIQPRGFERLASFSLHPWPTWTFDWTTPAGHAIRVVKELCVPRGAPMVLLTWRLEGARSARLLARPLLACRDHHALRRETEPDDPGCKAGRAALRWHPFADEPAIHAAHDGGYEHEPSWYRGFLYAEETRRGLDDREDLWSPGRFSFELTAKNAARLVFSAAPLAARFIATFDAFKRREAKRRGPAPKTPRAALFRAAESYIVRRGKGRSIIAGYPWFTDWGRDTFISLRGLCLAPRRLDVARGILIEWAKLVDHGMLPNFFPDGDAAPHFNSVDASLWFIVTAGEYLKLARDRDRAKLVPAMTAILKGYRDGARFGIGLDADGLIRAGVPGWQLTWMDAKYEDECFTPRIGKPVEIQALWLAALDVAAKLAATRKERAEWDALREKGAAAFRARFWNPKTRALFDVVDGPDGDDPAIRPNQLFAISLHDDLLPLARARAVVRTAERELLTPMGLRTLARNHPDYHGEYEGNHRRRDAAYHQGTVWPWLIGPFVEAWLKVNGGTAAVRARAGKFLTRLEAHLGEGCLGQITEVASGDPPHRAGGCTAQAWSVAEMLRVSILIGK